MEYIKNIEIKNFKSIRHQTIDDCRRVNVFIGYPNVGKSNILEALGLYCLLKLGTESFDFNEICRVRSFVELFFNQDAKKDIEVKLNSEISLGISLNFNADIVIKIQTLIDSKGEPDSLQLAQFKIDKNIKLNSYPNISESSYKHIISGIRKYDFKKDVQVNKQKGLALSIPNGDNLLDILQGTPQLRKAIAEIFDTYGLRLLMDRADQSIKFLKELHDGTAIAIPYFQVADTLQRLVFYKAAIKTNKENVLLFEEPEAHMFPPYISKFTSDVVYDDKSNQFFIATHSPFVLNDFMEDVDKEDLSVYAVGYKKETGETIVRRITEDEMEEIYQYGVDLFFNLENYLKDAV